MTKTKRKYTKRAARWGATQTTNGADPTTTKTTDRRVVWNLTQDEARTIRELVTAGILATYAGIENKLK